LELARLRNLLSSELSATPDADSRPAAVLVVIYGQIPHVIMTEKPKTMQPHGGEISFPGGKMTGDDAHLLDTAVRETREELSLDVSPQQVIGQLRPVTTRNSGFTITPFVAILDEIPQLRPNEEVEEILQIPLIPLLKTLRVDSDPEHRALFEAYVLSYQNKTIWGASARILKQIADIIGDVGT
jgi:8-oxo-dGTP pyrophosphatase MutT (NUDIX family)